MRPTNLARTSAELAATDLPRESIARNSAQIALIDGNRFETVAATQLPTAAARRDRASTLLTGLLVGFGGLGTHLIALGRSKAQQSGPLHGGIVITALSSLAILGTQASLARPPRVLQLLILGASALTLGGVALATIGAVKHLQNPADPRHQSGLFIGGVVMGACGAATLLPSLVTQSKAPGPFDRHMVAEVSGAVIAVAAALVIGFAAAVPEAEQGVRLAAGFFLLAATALVLCSAGWDKPRSLRVEPSCQV